MSKLMNSSILSRVNAGGRGGSADPNLIKTQ